MLLMQISNDSLKQSLSDDARKAFNKWYQEQMQSTSPPQQQQQQQQASAVTPAPSSPDVSPAKSNNNNSSDHSNSFRRAKSSSSSSSPPTINGEVTDSNPPGSKTNVRTWFDSDTELPLLQTWLGEKKHPSRGDMLRYLEELNRREYRRTHRPLDLSNLSYWFKNARARSSVLLKPGESNWGFRGKPTAGVVDHHRRVESVKGGSGDDRLPPSTREDTGGDVVDRDRSRNGSDESVPILPNCNAVYVINPLLAAVNGVQSVADDSAAYQNDAQQCEDYSSSSIESEDESPPVKMSNGGALLKSERNNAAVESDENHNERLRETGRQHHEEEHGGDLQDQATDLSVRSSVKSEWTVDDHRVGDQVRDSRSAGGCREIVLHTPDWKSNRGGREMTRGRELTRERESTGERELKRSRAEYSDEEFSDSDSPPPAPSRQDAIVASSNYLPQFTFPPHLHAFQQQQHAALQQQQQHALHQQQHALRSMMSHAMRGFMNHPPTAGYNALPRGMFHPALPPLPPPSQTTTPLSYDDDNTHDSSGSNNGDSDRKKRSRVFIDPLSEIPKLEQWFLTDSHPSSFVIEQFTNELNRATYRQRFPPLEPKNVQLWFKNHRAKVKRQRLDFAQMTSAGCGEHAATSFADTCGGSFDAKSGGGGAMWDARIVVKPELLSAELPSRV